MGNIILILLGLIIISSAENGIEAEFSKVLQKALRNSITNYLSDVQGQMSKVVPKSQLVASNYPRQLTPAVIQRALYNLKGLLPEIIPMIPFAVAEPTSSNILFYFGILNSYFRNLTKFTSTASVSNTVSRSSIGIDFQLNTSSLQGHYELDVSSYGMHLYGDGEYSIISNETNVSVLTNIKIFMDDSFEMTDFLFNISISSAQLAMSNLLGGDPSSQKLIEVISENIPSEVATLNSILQQTVNSSVVDFTNSYFAAIMSWSDVVAFVYDIADI